MPTFTPRPSERYFRLTNCPAPTFSCLCIHSILSTTLFEPTGPKLLFPTLDLSPTLDAPPWQMTISTAHLCTETCGPLSHAHPIPGLGKHPVTAQAKPCLPSCLVPVPTTFLFVQVPVLQLPGLHATVKHIRASESLYSASSVCNTLLQGSYMNKPLSSFSFLSKYFFIEVIFDGHIQKTSFITSLYLYLSYSFFIILPLKISHPLLVIFTI